MAIPANLMILYQIPAVLALVEEVLSTCQDNSIKISVCLKKYQMSKSNKMAECFWYWILRLLGRLATSFCILSFPGIGNQVLWELDSAGLPSTRNEFPH